jgi:flavin-dependent dehydrogenase
MIGIVLLVAQLTSAARAAGGSSGGTPAPAAAASSAPAVARTEPRISATATSRNITVSLTAKAVAVEELLAQLFQTSGQSYVFAPGPASGPSGRSREVTVSFKDVDVEKAVALVCDAAGLQFPISGEGIGTALESGLMAAEAVASVAAGSTGGDAAAEYLGALAPLQATLADMYAEVAHVRTLAGEALLDGLYDGFAHSLEIG